MDAERAEKIIQLALQKGILSGVDLDLLEEKKVKSANSKINALQQEGLLSNAMVRALEDEIGARRTQQGELAGNTNSITRRFNAITPPGKEARRATSSIDNPASIYSAIDLHASGSSIKPEEKNSNLKFGRYELLGLLGEGGMGSVFKAYDATLNRFVALKFITSNKPESTKRLLLEGRAQARIDHPNVCKVYEVGEIEGKFFSAMQYINGETLKTAMCDMTMEEKVKIVADVAEGLRAAHQECLIHRDIKPHNIMVEKSADGAWKPYLMDFGLVREVDNRGITVTGDLLGTPAYMAPEQARGKTDHLDRRTDIYSLGATLYELLTGQPPFDGFEIMEVMQKVINEDAPPLRKIDASIPIDLETIVLKCLEKEQQQRYDSAKALREDLMRYLAGEPIAGKRASWLYRWRKKIENHRVVAIIVAIAISIGLALASMGLYARWQAGKQSALAQKYGEQVRELEAIMRYGHLSPLHRISREESLVRLRLQKMSAEIAEQRSLSGWSGQYALGRGYQVIGEYEKARAHLEEAIKEGCTEPSAAYALGMVLQELYKKRLEEISQTADRQIRELEQQKAEEEMRLPALAYLAQSLKASGESSEYTAALIAYLSNDSASLAGALQQADAAAKRMPWLYESKRLIGDINVKMGFDQQIKGNYEAAQQAFGAALNAYDEAIKMGVSDPKNYESITDLLVDLMKANYDVGEPAQDYFDKLLIECDHGLEVNPNWSEGHAQKARGYFWRGQFLLRKGEDPLGDFQAVIAEAHKALTINSNLPSAYSSIGMAYLTKAQYQLNRGEDPTLSLDESIASYDKVLQLNPTYISAYSSIGLAYWTKAQYQFLHGDDPAQSLIKTIENCQKLLEIYPNLPSAYNSIGLALWTKGQYIMNKGEDARAIFSESKKNIGKGLEINKNFAPAYISLALALWSEAEFQLSRGNDPAALVAQIKDNCRKALFINPKYASAYIAIGLADVTKSKYQLLNGEDPAATLAEAIANYDQAIKFNANDAYTYLDMGTAYWVSERYLLDQERNPGDNLSQVLAVLEKSERINDKSYLQYQILGNVMIIQARWAIAENQSPGQYLEQGRRALDQAINLNHSEPENYRARGEIFRWNAEWLLKRGSQPRNEIEQGLINVDQALTINPMFAEAYATKGALELLQAHMEKDPARRIEIANKAREHMEKAFSINKLLDKDCQRLLNEAKKYSKL